MYLQLGNILLEPLTSPISHAETQDTSWAEHALLNSKPRLQPTGQGLIELTMSIRFHAKFCNVKDSFKKLSDARDSYTVLPLLWGNGDVGPTYVITQLSNNRETSFADGTIESILVSIILKEFVRTPAQVVQAEKTHAQNNAIAINHSKTNGTKTTVAGKITNQPTCNSYIATQRMKLSALANVISKYNLTRNSMVLRGADSDSIETLLVLLRSDVDKVDGICHNMSEQHTQCMTDSMLSQSILISQATHKFYDYLNTNDATSPLSLNKGNALCLDQISTINGFIRMTQSMGSAAMLRR